MSSNDKRVARSLRHPSDLQAELTAGDLDLAYAAVQELLEVWDRLRQDADMISGANQDDLSEKLFGFVEGMCLFAFDWHRKWHSGFRLAIRNVGLALSICRPMIIPPGISQTPFGKSVAENSMTEMLLHSTDDLWLYLNESLFRDTAVNDFACYLDDSINKVRPSTGGVEDWILPDVFFDYELAQLVKECRMEYGLEEGAIDLESLFGDDLPLIIPTGDDFKVLTTRLQYSSTLKKAAAALQKATAFFNFDVIECEVRREFAAATAFRCQLGLTNRGMQSTAADSGTNEILECPPHDRSSPWDACFKNRRYFVWSGKKVQLPPREHRFLHWLLSSEHHEIPFEDALDACWGAQRSDKTLQNAVGVLNNLLEPLRFPIVFSTSNGHIQRDECSSRNFPANAGRIRDAT